MKHFARLFTELDSTTSTNAKVETLRRYFALANPADAAWAVYFLSGGKPRQVVKTSTLRALACDAAGIDDWLFDECYQAVGDLAETIAYILPLDFEASDLGLAEWIEQRLLPLRGLPEEEVALRGPYGGEAHVISGDRCRSCCSHDTDPPDLVIPSARVARSASRPEVRG